MKKIKITRVKIRYFVGMIKKYSSLFCFLFASVALSQSKSVLSQGDWYAFSIDTTGVFKIDNAFLSQLGVNTNGLDPKKIKIYGNGGQMLPQKVSDTRAKDLQECAIYVNGEQDGRFDNEDYVLFYGVGPHDWEVNPASGTVAHRQNIYSDTANYFLTIGATNGKRINTYTPPLQPSTTTISTYNDYIFYEKEAINLFAVGRKWFGEDFNFENVQNFRIPFPKQEANSALTVRVSGVTISSLNSTMNVTANGTNLTTLNSPPVSGSSISSLAIQRTGEGSLNTNASDYVDVSINYNNNGLPSARAYLDYIEIIGTKRLVATGKQFGFRSFAAANSAEVVSYRIQNPNNIDQVWRVTNTGEPQRVANNSSSGDFRFTANSNALEEFVVVNYSDTYQPIAGNTSKIENQNLHNLSDIQYLLITDQTLVTQANRLATYHSQNSNLSTQVVTLEQIYNEFASGSPDITGIRDFIKHLYNSSNGNKALRYVCFFGDSSYDYKDRITNNNNIVPTYHATQSFDLVNSYVTDDYYVMLEDEDGEMLTADSIDIASGRIPVTTALEAKDVVDKILSYYGTNSFGDWRNTITLLADDIDVVSDKSLQTGLEGVADSIKKYKPIFNVTKIYADAYKQENSSGGERYPEVNTALNNAVETGTLVFNYFGHGGEDGLGEERYLETPQIEAFNNPNTLPLFITVTCEFSRFDNPLRETAGERLFLNRNGGAVSMITTTRDVFISTGEQFNKNLSQYVLAFDNNSSSIAENLVKAKNTTSSAQKFFIYFFGDPAMRLAMPEPNIRITKMNGINLSQSLDTLKALSKVSFSGTITDSNNTVLNNFNGKLSTIIFDKSIDKQTLDNDGFGVINTFDTQESKLFRGQASVSNGQFTFEFIVPKDIKIAYGTGKISLYASNNSTDKGGANFDIVVGGINENAPEDNTGPEISAFLNDVSFVDGGNTNSSPNLIVKLADQSGINTSITAVDHDIVAILDDNASQPIILNDYYQTELDDFTKGEVTYKLRNLSTGMHTLKIKAWDTYNNSSETSLSFMVVSDATLSLTNVLNYPNPFVNYTEFWFNHNRPNEPLEVQVQVFTVAGKLVKTLNQLVETTGNLSREIQWNGLDDFGNKLAKGVYVYKLSVRSNTTNTVAETYEKLVIL